jgi:hypothetical protein
VILRSLLVDSSEFERGTGWALKPEGLCRDDRCVPLPTAAGRRVDARAAADRLGMPLILDEPSGLWCLGPEAGPRALPSARVPTVALPDLLTGREFVLSSLRGQKVLLVAWASW